MRITVSCLALAAALTLAACEDLPTIQAPGAMSLPAAAPGQAAIAGATLTGTVTAPAGVVADGAPAQRRLAEVGQAPLANAEVFLADAGGAAIPGIASVRTDANGKFAFKDVPKGFTFVVAAKAKTKDGKPALLQGLAKPDAQGADVAIDAASTLVTAGVVDGADLGEFDPATFKAATESARKQLTDADLPDLSDRAACVKRIGELASKAQELATAISQIKQSMKDLKKDLEELKKQLANRPRPQAQPPQPERPPVQVAATTKPAEERPSPAPRPTTAAPVTCEQAFRNGDANHDGTITLEEFLAPLANGETRNPDTFRRADGNGDGKVTPDELCKPQPAPTPTARPAESPRPTPTPTATPRPTPTATPLRCEDFLKLRDRNGDGTVTLEEWLAYQSPTGEKPAADGFKRIDLNADGKVTAQELCNSR